MCLYVSRNVLRMVELKKGGCWGQTSESGENRKIEDKRSENGTGKKCSALVIRARAHLVWPCPRAGPPSLLSDSPVSVREPLQKSDASATVQGAQCTFPRMSISSLGGLLG